MFILVYLASTQAGAGSPGQLMSITVILISNYRYSKGNGRFISGSFGNIGAQGNMVKFFKFVN